MTVWYCLVLNATSDTVELLWSEGCLLLSMDKTWHLNSSYDFQCWNFDPGCHGKSDVDCRYNQALCPVFLCRMREILQKRNISILKIRIILYIGSIQCISATLFHKMELRINNFIETDLLKDVLNGTYHLPADSVLFINKDAWAFSPIYFYYKILNYYKKNRIRFKDTASHSINGKFKKWNLILI